jgi:hypothetical protein
LIEFLFWEGCPSHKRALAMLTEEMDALGISRDLLRTVEVFTHEDAVERQFIGSPTIRLDGIDIADTSGGLYGLECRLYFHRDGRPSPLPDRDDLKEALERYASKGQ